MFPSSLQFPLICIKSDGILNFHFKHETWKAEGFDAAQAGSLVEGDVIPLGLATVRVCFLC